MRLRSLTKVSQSTEKLHSHTKELKYSFSSHYILFPSQQICKHLLEMLIIPFGVTRCVEIAHCGLKEEGEQEVN